MSDLTHDPGAMNPEALIKMSGASGAAHPYRNADRPSRGLLLIHRSRSENR